jgi:phage tail-like protein
MAVYGSKKYGSFRYGIASTTDISVYPFTTQSLDYGTIKLSWVYPTSTANFTDFAIVRNSLGFPVTPDGGDLIFKTDKTALTTAGPSSTSLLGLEGTHVDTGSFYDPNTGAITATYTATTAYETNGSTDVSLVAANASIKVGQAVTYTPSGYLTGANSGSGITGNTTVAAINGTNLTLSTAASIPAETVLTFTPTFLTPGKSYYYSAFVLSNNYWIRVGTALGTAIKNYSTADVLYGLLPQVYRASSTSASLDSNNRNDDLYNFLRVIGVQYDLIKTKVDTAKNRYDVANIDGTLLPALMDQMGFSYESGLGIQQSRRILSNADYIYLNKGTGQGLKRFVTSFTGYPATIAPFTNLFLTLDCSSFETSTGFWRSSATALSIVRTTADEEGGSPSPYSESDSPTGYPNSQLGYLKAEVTSVASGSTYLFRYGNSQDVVSITEFGSNDSTAGFSYITINTATEHGFSVGDTVNLQDMDPIYINGIHEIVAIPDSKSFVFYDSSVTASETIYPSAPTGKVGLYNPTLCGIPVTAGTAYTFSIYSMAKTTLRSISVGILWYDKLGTPLTAATTIGAVNNAVSTWTRIYDRNETAPTYAAYAVPYVRINSPANGEVHYFDAAQFEAAASETVYTDARRVDVHLNAPRVNEIINPGFEVDIAEWTTSGTTSSFTRTTSSGSLYPTSSVGLSTAISTGAASVVATTNNMSLAPTSSIPVTAGKPYAISAYIKGVNQSSATFEVIWRDSVGTALRTDTGTSTTLSTSFTRAALAPTNASSTKMYAPATAAFASVKINFTASSSGVTYIVDSVLFEQSDTVNPYFDGNTGYNVTDDLVWEQNAAGTKGTASTGRSLYYPNRLTTQNRLNAVLADYVPLGTSYAAIIGTTIS